MAMRLQRCFPFIQCIVRNRFIGIKSGLMPKMHSSLSVPNSATSRSPTTDSFGLGSTQITHPSDVYKDVTKLLAIIDDPAQKAQFLNEEDNVPGTMEFSIISTKPKIIQFLKDEAYSTDQEKSDAIRALCFVQSHLATLYDIYSEFLSFSDDIFAMKLADKENVLLIHSLYASYYHNNDKRMWWRVLFLTPNITKDNMEKTVDHIANHLIVGNLLHNSECVEIKELKLKIVHVIHQLCGDDFVGILSHMSHSHDFITALLKLYQSERDDKEKNEKLSVKKKIELIFRYPLNKEIDHIIKMFENEPDMIELLNTLRTAYK